MPAGEKARGELQLLCGMPLTRLPKMHFCRHKTRGRKKYARNGTLPKAGAKHTALIKHHSVLSSLPPACVWPSAYVAHDVEGIFCLSFFPLIFQMEDFIPLLLHSGLYDLTVNCSKQSESLLCLQSRFTLNTLTVRVCVSAESDAQTVISKQYFTGCI